MLRHWALCLSLRNGDDMSTLRVAGLLQIFQTSTSMVYTLFLSVTGFSLFFTDVSF